MNKRDIAKLYHYKARVLRVVDGDTIDVQIDLGFGMTFAEKPLADPVKGTRIRLHGIDAPESRTRNLTEKKKGLATKTWLTKRIEGTDVVLKTVKDGKGKYGRILGVVILRGRNVNKEMVRKGLAKEYFGGTK